MKTLYKILIVVTLNLILIADACSQSGWINQTLGIRNYVAVNYTTSLTGYIASDDRKILKTTNYGLNWILLNTNISLPATVIDAQFYNDSVYLFLLGSTMFFSTNAGFSWNEDHINPVGSGYVFLQAIDIINPYTAYVCGNDVGIGNNPAYLDGVIYKTTNSGVNWFQSARIGFYYNDIKFMDEKTGYATYGGVIKTTNGGNNWGYIGSVSYLALSINLPSRDTIYMCGKEGKIHRSVNAGINWITYQSPARDTLKNMSFINAKTGYAVGDSGAIVKTTNAGENWILQYTGTAKNLKSIYFINKDTGYVVGDSGIILRTYTGGVMVNVSYNNEIIPEKFILFQNYPNPFNPSTKISYELRVTSNVSLKVFDVLGNEVTALVNQKQNAGNYDIEYDGSNLPSGIYYYKLKSGDFEEARKMILIK